MKPKQISYVEFQRTNGKWYAEKKFEDGSYSQSNRGYDTRYDLIATMAFGEHVWKHFPAADF